MKKLIYLFLLTLPFSVHSQITFNDLKKLDSKEDFQRLCIEQGLERNHSVRNRFQTQYALNPDDEFELAEVWASYYDYTIQPVLDFTNTFYFQFYIDDGYDYTEHYWTYKNITNSIKNSCTFYKVDNDVVYYSCPGSLYPGKIGFYVENGNGHIQTNGFDFD